MVANSAEVAGLGQVLSKTFFVVPVCWAGFEIGYFVVIMESLVAFWALLSRAKIMFDLILI